MKKIILSFLSLAAIANVGQAQSMKVYQNGELKAIYYVSNKDSVVFSEDFPLPDEGTTTIDTHEAVDLGLSVKWATCNVGATQPEEYGDYFAWGETIGYNSGKTYFDCSTYKWCNGSISTQTKYCTSSDYGTVDNKTVLEAADDAAAVNWGGSWRMPTYEEQDELSTKCTWAWTTLNGVNGYNVVGPNGNSIFLPAAGIRRYSVFDHAGSFGHYWSSSLGSSDSYLAGALNFNPSDQYGNYDARSNGRSVRPVCR